MATEIICGAACTVTLQVEPAPPSPERMQDMSELWVLFLVAAVVIYCVRGILKIFEAPPHGD